jgi:deoxycytidylate deaminase
MLLPHIVEREKSTKEDYKVAAAKTAMRSNCTHHKHGSVIVDRRTGEIISRGYNYYTLDATCTYTCHSEIDAINKIRGISKHHIKYLDLYVVRVCPTDILNINKLKYSKPCEMCAHTISKFGIKRVYFSIDNNYTNIMCSLTTPLHKPPPLKINRKW